MSNRFMMSVAAAALIAGSGFAYAQGTGSERSGGSNVQQSAPSGGSATSPSGSTTNRDATESTKSDSTKPSSGMKATQSDQKSPGAAQNQRADEKMGQKPSSMSADDKAGAKTNSAQSKEGMSKEGMSKDAQTKSGTDSKTMTTGNAATSGTAAPPAEKRTQIASAIRSEKVAETTNVNFNISVGTVIPSTVRFYPLPTRIVEIYPEWRGYEFILVHGRYIVVRPQTHEIVYIIES